MTAFSAASVLHTRLRRRVASPSAVDSSCRGDRSRGRDPEGGARVFRPRSRVALPSCSTRPLLSGVDAEAATPCAHRLGERTKEAAPRAREFHPVTVPGNLLVAGHGVPGPGPRSLRAGLALAVLLIPRAFHGFDVRSDAADLFRRPHHLGARACLAAFALPLHPFARSDDRKSRSRPGASPVAMTPRLVEPCGLSSNAAPRCLDSASTTDVHVTSTRLDRRFRRLSAERRGGNRRRSTRVSISVPGVSACRFEIDAGPPCGDPASGRLRA